jgi:hypothetical protein
MLYSLHISINLNKIFMDILFLFILNISMLSVNHCFLGPLIHFENALWHHLSLRFCHILNKYQMSAMLIVLRLDLCGYIHRDLANLGYLLCPILNFRMEIGFGKELCLKNLFDRLIALILRTFLFLFLFFFAFFFFFLFFVFFFLINVIIIII